MNGHAARAPALARAVAQRGPHVVLDGGQDRGVRDPRDANGDPRRDQVDRRVESHLRARRTDLDGEPACAKQLSDFGGEIRVSAGGVVDDDLGVEGRVDTGRLPGTNEGPIGRVRRLRRRAGPM
jgi:hypothetical protein